MEPKHKAYVDWALIISIIGLLMALIGQAVQNYERLTRIETIVESETTLCDCFTTRSRVGVLELRVQQLEERLKRDGSTH